MKENVKENRIEKALRSYEDMIFTAHLSYEDLEKMSASLDMDQTDYDTLRKMLDEPIGMLLSLNEDTLVHVWMGTHLSDLNGQPIAIKATVKKLFIELRGIATDPSKKQN